MAFTLDPLPYANDALEPHIDAQTMEIHHDRHHQTYVTNLNNAIKDKGDVESKSLEELISNLAALPEDIRTVVRNNGGGHWNHRFFWESLSAQSSAPQAELAAAIDKAFGSFDSFKEAFAKAATTRFGSGWAWLVKTEDGLAITSTPNQDNPLMDQSGTPLLGLDVWEHAYYLKYQNKRPDYISAFWNIVNWEKVAERFSA